MKILYYLEPWIELKTPFFRFGTIRNHLHSEVANLKKSWPEAEITLVTGEAIRSEIAKQHYDFSSVDLVTIHQSELQYIANDYYAASMRSWRLGEAKENIDYFRSLFEKKLGSDYSPEIVICYEASVEFLKEIYPDALHIHNMLGFISREPFPETSSLDPLGFYKKSFLNSFSKDIKARKISSEESAFLETFRTHYLREGVMKDNPFSGYNFRTHYSKLLLLPLQVSNYFAFDGCFEEGKGYKTQLDYLLHVMENVDSSIGVIVTEHGFEPVLEQRVSSFLKDKYPNFIYEEQFRDVKWVSQYLLPYVDGVITVSSTVGFQAMLWQKRLITLGKSQLSPYAEHTSIQDLNKNWGKEYQSDNENLLAFLFTHYAPLINSYHHAGTWYKDFLLRSYERRDNIDFSFFTPIDSLASISKNYLKESRVPKTIKKDSAEKPDMSFDEMNENAKVVSFDVFDTLLVRKLGNPATIWNIMAPQVCEIIRSHRYDVPSFFSFSEERLFAAKVALERAKKKGREDVELKDIYDVFCERMKYTSQSLSAHLTALEEKTEESFITVRKKGHDLYSKAKQSGKKVVFVSDMYLSHGFVSSLLKKNGFGEDTLYISSDIGLRKKSGSIWKHVLNDINVTANEVLHIGDDISGDIETPRSRGFNVLHLPKITQELQECAGFKRIYNPDHVKNNLFLSATVGVTAIKLFDSSEKEAYDKKSLFNGSFYNIGYMAGGVVAFSFARWVIETAIKDGVEELYFLARDGWIVKEVAEKILPHYENPPQLKYIYASRRGSVIPSIRTEEDIYNATNMAFSSVCVKELLQSRFNVLETDFPNNEKKYLNSIISSGNADDVLGLKKFLQKHSSIILNCCATERENYLAYLKSEGMGSARKKAIVDIGHNGTLQLALNKLFETSEISGYYFVTFEKINKLTKMKIDFSSYLLHEENQEKTFHPYCKNIGMFEFLFLPDQDSFVNIEVDNKGGYQPNFVEPNETIRKNASGQVHRGILDYVSDVLTAVGPYYKEHSVHANDSIRIYLDFLMRPTKNDAKMFEGMFFNDSFGGNKRRYIIKSDDRRAVESWWKIGAETLYSDHGSASKIIGGGKFYRKMRKLKQRPVQFFMDSKLFKFVRKVA